MGGLAVERVTVSLTLMLEETDATKGLAKVIYELQAKEIADVRVLWWSRGCRAIDVHPESHYT